MFQMTEICHSVKKFNRALVYAKLTKEYSPSCRFPVHFNILVSDKPPKFFFFFLGGVGGGAHTHTTQTLFPSPACNLYNSLITVTFFINTFLQFWKRMNPLYGLCVFLPVIVLGLITLVGFGPGGVVAGSLAAKMMSVFGTTGFIPILQSIGAVGLAHPLLWIPTAILMALVSLCGCICLCL